MLTQAPLTTLKAAILVETDPAFVGYRSSGQNGLMAGFYNVLTSPAWIVWRLLVQTAEVGRLVNYVAVEALTDANVANIDVFIGLNPTEFEPREDVRSYWANVFSGALGGQGQATRDALEALWRRTATRGERLYTTGTGTTISPATLGWEGLITDGDIAAALAL